MAARSLSPPSSLLVAAALLPAWLALAWLVSRAQWFWKHNPELQFGWVVLMLCAYLIWEAWENRPQLSLGASALGISLALAGCGLLFLTQIYQSAYGLTAASMSGLALGAMLVIIANLHYAFGTRGVWHFAFGFAFIFIALPIPSVIYNPIVSGLQSAVAVVNVELLKLIGVPAQRVGSLIHLPSGTVGVDEACSGIRSLQSTVMATLFIGYLTLKRTSLKVTLLVAGIGLAIFGNLVRSLFLSYTANAKGLKAIDSFHDAAGWSILAFTAVGVSACAWLLSKAEKELIRPPATPRDATSMNEIIKEGEVS